MKKQTKTIIFLIALFSLLVGCSETTATNSKEALDEKTIPLPKVVTEETVIPVKQSSYCWGTLGCGDYVGGKATGSQLFGHQKMVNILKVIHPQFL